MPQNKPDTIGLTDAPRAAGHRLLAHPVRPTRSCLFAGLLILCLAGVFPGVSACAETAFLCNFDDGLDAVFAKGNGKARPPESLEGVDVRRVPGRFGKGVFLGRKTPYRSLSYETKGNMSSRVGALEFWFRPEWNTGFREPDGPAWLKGRASVDLFTTGNMPTGYRFTKNQYEVLHFFHTVSYRGQRGVLKLGDFWHQGEWAHYAVSWDEDEVRLFYNGRLLSVSDGWRAPTDAGHVMALGSGHGAWGTFDDFRISATKRYIGSFPVPTAPLQVEPVSKPGAVSVTDADAHAFAERRTTLFVDLAAGLTAKFAKGSGRGRTNRPPEFETLDGRRGLRFAPQAAPPGNTLCYTSAKNTDPFLGTAVVTVRFQTLAAAPVVLLDFSELVVNTPRRGNVRTGMRLVLSKTRCLEWQNLEENRVLGSVQSAPVTLKPEEWHALGVSWRGSVVTLLADGETVGRGDEQPLPSRWSKYVFVGSDNQGEDALDGWIGAFEVQLRQRVGPTP